MDDERFGMRGSASVVGMRLPAPLPPALADRAFRVDEAASLDLSRGRTRRTDLTSPLWGVRSPATKDFCDALAAPARIIAPDEAFSHQTAARILGLPLPDVWTADEPWHITGENELPRLRRRQVTSHRSLDHRDVVSVAGVRCTHPVVTWADLASTLTVDDLVIMGDAMVQAGGPVRTSDLRAEVQARARHRGVVRMREALSLVRVGSRSPMETTARLLFRRGGLPEPELNTPVLDDAGGWLAFGDFVWRERKVVAEFDGDYHRTNRRQWQIDVARREAVQEAGWTYLQLTARMVTVPAYAHRLVTRLRHLLL